MSDIKLTDLGELLKQKASEALNCIGMTVGTGCSLDQYEDIMYVTSQKKFWLLPENLATQLKQSAEKLADDVSIADKPARLQNLEKSGLIHCIATPKLISFLSEEEQKSYIDAKWLLDEKLAVDADIKMIYVGLISANRFGYGFKIKIKESYHPKAKQFLTQLSNELEISGYRQLDYEQDVNKSQSAFYHQCTPERNLLKKLTEKAEKQAYAAGYQIQENKIYTPEQIRIKQLIDDYLKNQDILQEHETVSSDGSGNIFEAIAKYKENITYLKSLYENPTQLMGNGQLNVVSAAVYQESTVDELQRTIEKQCECIIELANLGIAVPEFALGDKDPQKGMQQFHKLRCLQLGQEQAVQALRDQFDIFYKASGSLIVPPLPIFDNYIAAIITFDDQINEIKKSAEKSVSDSVPPMLLFWDPSAFIPKEAQWLVKGDMPLREFTIASGDKALLSHISLYDVVAKNTALFNALNVASQHIKSLNDVDSHFESYLRENLAYPIEFDTDWYDEEKSTFKAETFFSYLDTKGFKIKSIESDAQRTEWTKTLNAIIFDENVKRHIMGFDSSLSGAFIRLLGGSNMAQMSFETKGPTMENLTGSAIELKLNVAPLHGQVDLFNFNLPKPTSAVNITLPYYTYRGEQKQLDLGHFYMNLKAKAWGFAGVSLMAGAQVSLSDDLGKVGIKVTDTATAKSSAKTGTGATTKFSLFAGVQAGIEMTAELMWQPPANLTTFESIYPKMENATQTLTPTFKTLSKIQGDVAGQLGASLSAGFGIILKDGKLHVAFKINAAWGMGGEIKVMFEVDYRSIGQLVQIVCKALIDNDMQPLAWVANDALDQLLKIGVLGVTFPTVTYWSFWAATKLDEFYQSIICNGNGGIIGYYMTRARYRKHFEEWFMILPAQSIGPLLWTLTGTPKAFTTEDDEFTEDDALIYQQQAINLCLAWIKQRAGGPFSQHMPNLAQRLFESAVCRMNVHGVIDTNQDMQNMEYCKNRFGRLEKTMKLRPNGASSLIVTHENEMNIFITHVEELGCHKDHHCVAVSPTIYFYNKKEIM